MLKITLQKIVNAQGSLEKLLSKELPIKTAYRLGRAVSKLNSELTQFQESRKALIKKYGIEDGKGGFLIPEDDAENRKKFETDIKELLEVEVEISGFSPVPIAELDGVKIAAMDMANLEEFIDASE
jgi:hypothetical protein